MREIKFRAWDKDEKMMIYQSDDYYAFCISNDGVCVASEDTGNWIKCEIMQYTGLKDKNGTEAYEGDILHADGYWDMYVKFIDGSFCLVSCNRIQEINWSPMFQIKAELEWRKVIGNIYENPELLTK
jgi:uncharacterized phage protein (TIGR01671 family)